MNNTVKLTDTIHWIGVNDRRTYLFENLWPLDKGISYNAYLINDEKAALIDTVDEGFTDDFINKITHILGDKPIDYLVINHIEPDHSGSIKSIIAKYPDIKIVGNKKTVGMLKGFYGITENIEVIDDKDTINLGNETLTFYLTSLVHWPETMMTYTETEKILFSGDAFGTFGTLDGVLFDDETDIAKYNDEIRRYYSNIVGKYAKPVQKALKKVSGLDINMIATTHGPVWRSHISDITDKYTKWSNFEAETGVVIAYGSMYGNTEKIADHIARELTANGIETAVHDVSKSHVSYILSDIFKYNGVILGTPTYNGEMFPLLENLVTHINNIKIKNRYAGVFGSQSWGGGGVKKLNEFLDTIKWEKIAEPAEAYCSPDEEIFSKAEAIASAMTEKLNT